MPTKRLSRTPWAPSTSTRFPACSASYKNFCSRTASTLTNTARGCGNFCASIWAWSYRTPRTKASFPVCWGSFSGRPAKEHRCWPLETTCGRRQCPRRLSNSRLNLIIYKTKKSTGRSRRWTWESRRRTSRRCSRNLMIDTWIIMIFRRFWAGERESLFLIDRSSQK